MTPPQIKWNIKKYKKITLVIIEYESTVVKEHKFFPHGDNDLFSIGNWGLGGGYDGDGKVKMELCNS